MSIRHPVVAGILYPDRAEELHAAIDAMLAQAPTPSLQPKALIVPHANYIYSGPVAASAFRLLEPLAAHIHKVVLLGPSHRMPLTGIATTAHQQFYTPLGAISIDQPMLATVSQLSYVHKLDTAHQWEHSLEIQLPFLQIVLQEFTLLPLVVGKTTPHQVAELLATIWGGRETLIVVSSDLSHSHQYLEARQIDRDTTDQIEQLSTDLKSEQACGHYAVNGLLQMAAQRLLYVTTLNSRNSGDTTGELKHVVGFGAYALCFQPARFPLSPGNHPEHIHN